MFLAEIDKAKAAPETTRFDKPVTPQTRYDIAGVPQVRMEAPSFGEKATEMGTLMGSTVLGALTGAESGPGGIVTGSMSGAAAGSFLNQLRRMSKDPNYKFQKGEFLTDVATAGVPGGPATGTGVKAVLREGLKQGATALGGAELQSMIDRGRLLSGEEAATAGGLGFFGGAAGQKLFAGSKGAQEAVSQQQANRSLRSRSADAGAQLGLKAPVSDVEKLTEKGVSETTKQLSSLAGADALKFETRLQNRNAVNEGVREDLGLPRKGDTTIGDLRAVRDEAAQPYAEIGQIGETGKAKVQQIKDLREQLTRVSDPMEKAALEEEFDKAFASTKERAEIEAAADVAKLTELRAQSRRARDQYYASNGTLPQKLEEAMAARESAQALEVQIEDAVRRSGKPELADRLKAARERIAKSYNAEDALNRSTGDFDAREFGRQIDRGAPLSGNLKAIGDFANTFPRAFGDVGATPAPGINKLGTIGRFLTGGAVYGSSGGNIPLSVAAAFAPEIGGTAARKYLLSSGAQQAAFEKLRPQINAPMPLSSIAARLAGTEGGKTVAQPPEVTKEAVDFLIKNPETAADFDAKFGRGLAAKILRANR